MNDQPLIDIEQYFEAFCAFCKSFWTPDFIWGLQAVGIGVAGMFAVTLTFAVIMRLSIGRRMEMDDWPQSRN